jgi:hypothetical protein
LLPAKAFVRGERLIMVHIADAAGFNASYGYRLLGPEE